MTSPQAGNPIDVQIEKVRNIQPGDSVIAKAVAEAVGEELAALFRASRYRRIFLPRRPGQCGARRPCGQCCDA